MASDKMGTLYIGSTTDLILRVGQHKAKFFEGFTKKYGVDKIVYYEVFTSLKDMVVRERQLKKWNRNWKLRLIIEKNPGWEDLWDEMRTAGKYARVIPAPEYCPENVNRILREGNGSPPARG